MKTIEASSVHTSARRGARRGAALFDGIIVDYFAGGGGASTGIERAMGRCVDVAVNHDEAAIVMHTANHPECRHYCQDVFSDDPRKVTGGRKVHIFWASPDCRHFSRAKGSTPVKKQIRGLAWAVVRFVDGLKPVNRPEFIFLENVREFEDWGPLLHSKGANGRLLYTEHGEPVMIPDHSRKGETFKRFVRKLRGFGYHVEWRPINAADQGAPTHRRRLVLVARRDGKPIRWPVPTHGPKSPKRRKYKSAASCIDWGRPCPSIFLDRDGARRLAKETGIRCNRPLRRKTMERIARGLVRYVIDAAKPFVVTINHTRPEFRGHAADEPFNTLTASRDAHGLITPYLVKYYGCGTGSAADAPIHTLTTKDRCAVVTPFVAGVGCRAGPTPPTAGNAPLGTITAKNDRAVLTPYLVRANHGGEHFRGQRVDQPLPTLTTSKTAAAVEPSIAPFLAHRYGEAPHQDARGQTVDAPLNTITPANNAGTLLAAFLAKIGQQGSNGLCASDVADPLSTICSKNEHLNVAAALMKFRGDSAGSPVTDPMPTVTGGGQTKRPAGAAHALGMIAAYLVKLRGSGGANSVDVPLDTVIAGATTFGPVTIYLVHMNHDDKQWSAADEPMRTVMSVNHAAVIEATLSAFVGPAVWKAFNHVYAFLLEYVGPDAPLPLVTIKGQLYLIVNIGMRMLVPRELARGQGFDKDYILTGTASQQVARIGNSVSPPVAEAIIRANCVEEGVAA